MRRRSRQTSDVEVRHGAGILFDELPPGLHLIAHELGEDAVGDGGVLERHLREHARGRGHRGFAQLIGVHLAQALEALELDALLCNRHHRRAEGLEGRRLLTGVAQANLERGDARELDQLGVDAGQLPVLLRVEELLA